MTESILNLYIRVYPSTATNPPGRGLPVITRPAAPPPRSLAGAASRGRGAASPPGRGSPRATRRGSTALAPPPSTSAKDLYLGLRICDGCTVLRAVGVRLDCFRHSFFGFVDAMERFRQWALQCTAPVSKSRQMGPSVVGKLRALWSHKNVPSILQNVARREDKIHT